MSKIIIDEEIVSDSIFAFLMMKPETFKSGDRLLATHEIAQRLGNAIKFRERDFAYYSIEENLIELQKHEIRKLKNEISDLKEFKRKTIGSLSAICVAERKDTWDE